ncbi:MAG: creatininase family protein [Firmicutes bacterium]|nr:creatininase family protein [Bacillota bacterium]
MRTRNLNKMTNDEVEAYLAKNDILFVPVGVVETHGGLPVDCETILAEAYASRLADAADGLFVTGLPFFYAGCTTTGRATVQVSIEEGVKYLKTLARSFLKQGFRRQVYLTNHGTAYLTVGTVIRDIFDETGAPLLYIYPQKYRKPAERNRQTATDIFCGAYKIMGCLEDIPLNVPEGRSISYEDKPQWLGFAQDVMTAGPPSGTLGHLVTEPTEHVPTMVLHSEEEREESAKRGIATIEEAVANIHIDVLLEKVRKIDKHFQEDVIPRNPWVPMSKA